MLLKFILLFLIIRSSVHLLLQPTLISVVVNQMQHLVTRYGDHLLQSIQQLSKQLDLSLDGAAAVEASQANNSCKAYTITKQPKDLPPAKYGAWKMWQEDGLSAEKIAVSFIY